MPELHCTTCKRGSTRPSTAHQGKRGKHWGTLMKSENGGSVMKKTMSETDGKYWWCWGNRRTHMHNEINRTIHNPNASNRRHRALGAGGLSHQPRLSLSLHENWHTESHPALATNQSVLEGSSFQLPSDGELPVTRARQVGCRLTSSPTTYMSSETGCHVVMASDGARIAPLHSK